MQQATPEAPQEAGPAKTIVARFSEITLKGRNRPSFEKRMERNAALHLAGHGKWKVRRSYARLTVSGEGDPATAVAILKGLPGVANVSLVRHISREPAALAEGALERARADIAVSATGIAGPGGGTPTKPVGLVHMAAARRGGDTLHRADQFAGDRQAVRGQAVDAALALLLRQAETAPARD